MASTYTPLGIEKMATGENAGTWGTKTNNNLDLISELIGGFAQVSIAGGAQTTDLTVVDGATTGTAQRRMIEFTGTITGNQIVTIPNDVETFYILRNSTSGAYTVQFKYATGSGDTFTFSATNKGDKILFAAADDGTNPNIKTLAIGTGIANVVEDTTPQLGGNLDANGNNILIDNGNFIGDENGLEQIKFATTSSAVNEFSVTNAATGNDPSLSATGDDSNISVAIKPKGTGETVIGTGAAAATLTTSGAHDLILDTNKGTNSGNITITDGANGNIDVTTNGTGVIKFNDLAYYPEVAITSTANAVAWDSQAAPNAKHTTTENTTFSAPTNATTGSFISVNIAYGGAHTIAWNTVFEFAASTAPTATSTSGKTDHLVFRYNGTVWQEMGRTLNMSST